MARPPLQVTEMRGAGIRGRAKSNKWCLVRESCRAARSAARLHGRVLAVRTPVMAAFSVPPSSSNRNARRARPIAERAAQDVEDYPMRRISTLQATATAVVGLLLAAAQAAAQLRPAPARRPNEGSGPHQRLVIRNAMLIDGAGAP